MEKEKLLSLAKDISGAKIIVVGDIGLDCYIQGDVRRISPEAPVPVLEVSEEFQRLGLSCNVAQNLKHLGGEPILISAIGDDLKGESLCQELQAQEISTEYLVKDSTRPTTVKTRIMSQIHHIVRIDHEQRQFLNTQVQDDIYEKVSRQIQGADALILQDYAKGVITESLSQRIIGLAKKHNKLVLVDPNDKTPLEYYKGASLMTPNFSEAIKLSRLPIDDLRQSKENLAELGNEIRRIYDSDRLIITRSKDGMTLFDKENLVNVPTFARQVYDVTGAGDTVIAVLAMALAKGASLEMACHLANYAAGVVVGKVGCVPCSYIDLVDSINSFNS